MAPRLMHPQQGQRFMSHRPMRPQLGLKTKILHSSQFHHTSGNSKPLSVLVEGNSRPITQRLEPGSQYYQHDNSSVESNSAQRLEPGSQYYQHDNSSVEGNSAQRLEPSSQYYQYDNSSVESNYTPITHRSEPDSQYDQYDNSSANSNSCPITQRLEPSSIYGRYDNTNQVPSNLCPQRIMSSHATSDASFSNSQKRKFQDDERIVRSVKRYAFNADSLYTDMEKVTKEVGVVGSAVKAIISVARSFGSNTEKALTVFKDPDHINLLKTFFSELEIKAKSSSYCSLTDDLHKAVVSGKKLFGYVKMNL